MTEERTKRRSAVPHREGILGCFLALFASVALSLTETLMLTRLWQDPASSTGANGIVALMMLLTVFPLLFAVQGMLFGAGFLHLLRPRR